MIALAAKTLLRTVASTAADDSFANMGFRLFRDSLLEVRKSGVKTSNPEGHLAQA